MGYLASARRGLTEIEILEILYREREYGDSEYGRFLDNMTRQTGHRLPDDPKRIPIAIWSRLRFDLAPYLTEHAAPNGTVLNFYHRNLFEAVRECYLPSEEQQRQAHGRLAEYFQDQDYWLESLEEQQRRAKTFPPTPRPANVRKVDELPYHVLEVAKLVCKVAPNAKEWDAVVDLLTNWHFLEAKTSGCGPHMLIDDFDITLAAVSRQADFSRLPQSLSPTLATLRSALRLSAYTLTADPLQLAAQLTGRLMNHFQPQLRKLLNEIHPDGKSPWLSPLTQSLTPPNSSLLLTLASYGGSVTSLALLTAHGLIASASD